MNRWILVLLLAAPARAAGGGLEYHGRLSDAAGKAQGGTFLLRFRLWDAITGGRSVWEESRYVRAAEGAFSVRLGDKRPLPEAMLATAFRLSVDAPAATGWSVAATEPLRVLGAAAAQPPAPAKPPAPANTAPAPPSPQAAPAPETAPAARPEPPRRASSTVAEAELERIRAESRAAREEAERARRKIEELERRVEGKPGAPAPRSARVYVARKGDTLRSIAERVYGDPDRWIELYRANEDRIQRGGELVDGQLLLVPDAP